MGGLYGDYRKNTGDCRGIIGDLSREFPLIKSHILRLDTSPKYLDDPPTDMALSQQFGTSHFKRTGSSSKHHCSGDIRVGVQRLVKFSS